MGIAFQPTVETVGYENSVMRDVLVRVPTRVASVSDKTINITGSLSIKGVTLPVTFPVGMEVKNGIVNANGKLTIDRIDWGIRYKSGKFYDILADQVVSDDIEFHMKIVAKE